MKKFLRIALLSAVVVMWGGKSYAETPETIELQPESTSEAAVAAEKQEGKAERKRDWGRLSGSFETNTIRYMEDKKTGALVPKNSYGSNNYLKLDYQKGRFLAGVQVEYYPHPLVGTPAEGSERIMEGFGWGNLTRKYVSWVDRSYSITLGDYYEQFGSGLVLRSWEDRTLNINNALGGGRVTYNFKDIFAVKAIFGFPQFYLEYLSTQIAGGDVSLSLSNLFGMNGHMLSIEGSVVNRYEKGQPDWFADFGGEELYGFNLPKNVLNYSGRINYEFSGFQAKFEYVGKGKDVYAPFDSEGLSDRELKNGNAQLAEVGYSGDGFAVVAQFRRLRYMQSQLFRPSDGNPLGALPNNTMNYVPALSTQHTYMLASLDPNTPNLLGEMGGQIDAFYNFKRGTALGGKRGLKIHANFAMTYSLNGATPEPGKNFLFRDFSFDIDKSWNKKLRTVLFVSLQKNALHGVDHFVSQNVFVADVTYKFTPKFSLRAELQYLYAPNTEGVAQVGGDWVAGLLEANFAPKWSVFASDMYNLGSTKIHYYSAGASFTHSFARVALSYGRNRAGMICSGGVCRYMPAYTGANLQVTLTW